MKDLEGKVEQAKVDKIRRGSEELKKLLEAKPRDTAKVKAKLDETNTAMQEASVELYKKYGKAPDGGQGSAGAGSQNAAENAGGAEGDKVVDADYKVDDKK